MSEHTSQFTNGRPPAIRIERVAWKDLRAVAAIQKVSFRPGLAYGISALTLLRIMPGVGFLVARANDLPVAGCVIADRSHGDLRIMNLAVHPDARRRGIGTALLQAIEAEMPGGNVMLMAEQWNTDAQRLYERDGYSRKGLAKDYYGHGRHGVRMTKQRMASNENRIVV